MPSTVKIIYIQLHSIKLENLAQNNSGGLDCNHKGKNSHLLGVFFDPFLYPQEK
jgi:hypothetical protein